MTITSLLSPLPYDLHQFDVGRLSLRDEATLRQICQEHNLETHGNKQQLIDRLLKWKKANPRSPSTKAQSNHNPPEYQLDNSSKSPGQEQPSPPVHHVTNNCCCSVM